MDPSPTGARVAAVGDVVLCRDDAFRESLKIPRELGLVVEARRERARVHLPSVGGEPWIPLEQLARVKQPVGASEVAIWMQRAHFLARSLDALLVEVTHVGADGCALRIFHGEIEVDELDRLRAALGDELRYWRLLPAGLHKLESAIAFVAREREDAPQPVPRADPAAEPR
jgi:hypothetical protein